MKRRILPTLALACALSSAASADVRTSNIWMQGTQGSAFATAHVDLDDEAQSVSVMADFQGLAGECTGGRLVGAAGQTLCVLSAPASGSGFAFGTATVDAGALNELLLGQAQIELNSAAHPTGELFGSVAFLADSFVFPLTAQQAQPSSPSPAWGSGYTFFQALGGASFSGQLHNLQGAVTSIEVRRGAWYGDTGPLMLTIHTVGNPSANLVTCSGSLPALTADERRDLADGLCYMLVRTSAFPEGELRGQLTPPWLGDGYGAQRPNSVAFGGAKLSAYGSPLASTASVQLHGESLPPGKVVLPIVGLGTGHVYAPTTLGGLLCVGGAGTARLGAYAGVSSGSGTFDAQVELTGATLGGLLPALEPDTRLNFQLWYRDPTGPTPTALSSAVSIRFR